MESEKRARHEIVFKIFEFDAKLDTHKFPQSTADETWRRIYSESQESQLESVSQSLDRYHQNWLAINHKNQTLQKDFSTTLQTELSHLHSKILSLQDQISTHSASHQQITLIYNNSHSENKQLQTKLDQSETDKKSLQHQLTHFTENLESNASEFESKLAFYENELKSHTDKFATEILVKADTLDCKIFSDRPFASFFFFGYLA